MTVATIWKNGRIIDAKDQGARHGDMLMMTALLCNNAGFDGNKYKDDPTETALLKWGGESTGIRITTSYSKQSIERILWISIFFLSHQILPR